MIVNVCISVSIYPNSTFMETGRLVRIALRVFPRANSPRLGDGNPPTINNPSISKGEWMRMECRVSTTAATAQCNWNPRFKQHRKKIVIREEQKTTSHSKNEVRRFVLQTESNPSQRQTVKRTVRVVNFGGKNCQRIVDRSTKGKNGCHAWKRSLATADLS